MRKTWEFLIYGNNTNVAINAIKDLGMVVFSSYVKSNDD